MDPMILYVSPTGDDCHSGALPVSHAGDGPLASLVGAREAIRRYTRAHGGVDRPITVVIQAGVYALAETPVFGPEDSGTGDCPIRYVAAEGAAPVLSGGRRIEGWQETTHRGLRCWVADLPEVAAGEWHFTRLYVRQQARPRPRLPKEGFYRFTGLAGYVDSQDHWCQGPDRANYAPGEIQRWQNWEDVEVISYQLWFDTHHRIKAIDEETHTVSFHANSLGSLRDERNDFARYFVENVFEALDTPGQWYLDRAAGRLYYLPLPEETPADTVVYAPRLEQLLLLIGEHGQRVTHLHFENLTFAHQQWELPKSCPGYIQAAFGVPGAVVLDGAEACVLYGCTVTQVNSYGIEVLAGSTRNTIAACAVHDAGGGGIKLGHEMLERADPTGTTGKTLAGQDVPAMATTVVDCTIRDCGQLYPSAIGIWVGNSGWNRLLHNHIFHCNYTGISCGWNWGYAPTRTVANLIEDNHIHHINHREILSDNGGIYTLGIQPGTVLRGNVIHDISCYGYGAWGIYPDEGSSEILIERNLVYGTKKASYSMHYGRDVLVRGNIFALSEADHLGLGKRELHRSTIFRQNIVLTGSGRIASGDGAPAHGTVADNLFWPLDGSPLTFNGKTLAQVQADGQNTGAVVADPLFTDAAGGDFSLRTDSPATTIGFTPFDWRAAGPRMATERPYTYAEYTRQFPMPAFDIPVVRTQIELTSPDAEIAKTGTATFTVTLMNIGRAVASGSVRLSAGPDDVAQAREHETIAFTLAPGEEQSKAVSVAVKPDAPYYWLEAEGVGDAVIPARKLVWSREALQWNVSRVANIDDPAQIAGALAALPARQIMRDGLLVAEVTLAATEHDLLFHALLHQPILRPHLTEPWLGTGIELLVPSTAPFDRPSDVEQAQAQLFIVPMADGTGAAGLRLVASERRAEPAPDIQTWAQPLAEGCEVTARIPWKALRLSGMPKEFPFEMIVDVLDPATGGVCQLMTFDIPWDGWQRRQGRVVIAG